MWVRENPVRVRRLLCNFERAYGDGQDLHLLGCVREKGRREAAREEGSRHTYRRKRLGRLSPPGHCRAPSLTLLQFPTRQLAQGRRWHLFAGSGFRTATQSESVPVLHSTLRQ